MLYCKTLSKYAFGPEYLVLLQNPHGWFPRVQSTTVTNQIKSRN